VPHCAWCGKVRVGGHWNAPDELPGFLGGLLDGRRTHGICPDCFTEVERQTPPARTAVLIRTSGPDAVECLLDSLDRYQVRERPEFVLEATLPDPGGAAVNTFLSAVSRCLAESGLEQVTIELADHTYLLESDRDAPPLAS
jgi:hypothetical protein